MVINSEGYIVSDKPVPGCDEVKPGLWAPYFEPCKHRVLRAYTAPCGKKKHTYFCRLKTRTITPNFCEECNEIESR